jgi:hypothetical protein
MKDIIEILNKLQKVKKLSSGGYAALCPAHEDHNPSLSVTQKDNKILLHCHAGCATDAVISHLQIEIKDLFIDNPETTTPVNPAIAATYDYKDEKGNVLYQVVRQIPKSFIQRHKNGGGEWIYNMDGVRRVLYHLPDIIRLSDDETCYIVEGEKDVDNLWNCGKIATTNAMGAVNWQSEFAKYFTGKKVVLIPHRDSAGNDYAKAVARSLEGKARELKVVLLDRGKDISDFLELDGDVSALPLMEQDISVLFDADKPRYQREEDAIAWHKPIGAVNMIFKAEKPSEERTGIHARISIMCDYAPLGWSYFTVERSEDRTRLANAAQKLLKGEFAKTYTKEDISRDLDAFCAGLWTFHVSGFTPELMTGDETEMPPTFLLYPYVLDNGGTILYAPPGRGKSYTGLLWAQSINEGVTKIWRVKPSPVLFINLERSRQSLRRRLATVNKALGIPGHTALHTINARGKSLSDVFPTCREYIKRYGIKVIVLDSVSRAGYGDLNENQPVNKIIDALSSLCPSWIALAHTSRANEDHAFGSIMLDAGADICVQLSSQITDDGTLGIGWEITKQNDIGKMPQAVYALEFNQFGLSGIRQAKRGEFPEVEAGSKTDMLTVICDWVLNRESSDATATEIESSLGYDRTIVSKVFNSNPRFVQTRKVKQSVYYGLKSNHKELLSSE